jgi:hypothetical protein
MGKWKCSAGVCYSQSYSVVTIQHAASVALMVGEHTAMKSKSIRSIAQFILFLFLSFQQIGNASGQSAPTSNYAIYLAELPTLNNHFAHIHAAYLVRAKVERLIGGRNDIPRRFSRLNAKQLAAIDELVQRDYKRLHAALVREYESRKEAITSACSKSMSDDFGVYAAKATSAAFGTAAWKQWRVLNENLSRSYFSAFPRVALRYALNPRPFRYAERLQQQDVLKGPLVFEIARHMFMGSWTIDLAGFSLHLESPGLINSNMQDELSTIAQAWKSLAKEIPGIEQRIDANFPHQLGKCLHVMSQMLPASTYEQLEKNLIELDFLYPRLYYVTPGPEGCDQFLANTLILGTQDLKEIRLRDGSKVFPPTSEQNQVLSELVRIFETGACNVPQDLPTAVRVMEYFTEHFNGYFGCRLSNWYFYGIGVPKSIEQAAVFEKKSRTESCPRQQGTLINPADPFGPPL